MPPGMPGGMPPMNINGGHASSNTGDNGGISNMFQPVNIGKTDNNQLLILAGVALVAVLLLRKK